MRNIFTSTMFVSWTPLLFYLSTRITERRDALLFGNRDLQFNFSSYGEGGRILVFYVIYFVVLYFFTKRYDVHIKKMLDQKHQIIFHSAVLSLFIMLASVFIQPGFDLIFKLGMVWCLALIQYLLSHLNYSGPAKALENTSEDNDAEISRNAQCPCGSGERYKHCCGKA